MTPNSNAARPYHGPDPTTEAPEPYRVFFPLGVLFGLVGVSIWPIYGFGWISTVSKFWHIDLMLHGFLFAFVLGFLMTALPRFSETKSATGLEIGLISGLFALGNVATFLNWIFWGRVLFFMTTLGLLFFGAKRLRHRKLNPPTEFIYVFLGILTAVFAAAARVFGTGFESLLEWEMVGRRLLGEGVVVLFVLGVGGKLIPLFFGHVQRGPQFMNLEERARFTKKHTWFLFLGLSFLFTFPLEYIWTEEMALYFRAGFVTLIALQSMRAFRLPKAGGVLVWFLWVSVWMILLSVWGEAYHPQYRVPTLHVMFIGGFGVMILCIATRVILGHGGWPQGLEKRSPHLLVGALLFLVALGFRSVAPLFPEKYFQLLSSAGIAWISGLLIWGITFSKKAIRPLSQG